MTEKADSVCYFILKRIEDIGTAQEILKNILDDDLFDNFSKHNPYWDSEHELEADKLEEIRLKISFLDERLWDLYSLLKDGSYYDR